MHVSLGEDNEHEPRESYTYVDKNLICMYIGSTISIFKLSVHCLGSCTYPGCYSLSPLEIDCFDKTATLHMR